jgi:hypothetical protein
LYCFDQLIPKRYEAERVLKAVSLISQGLQPMYYAHPHSRLVLKVLKIEEFQLEIRTEI